MDKHTRIKRLQYQSWYRGCKETDKILGGFARAKLEQLNDIELDEFEALLEEQDPDIFDWLTGKQPVPANTPYGHILPKLQAFDVAGLWKKDKAET